MREQLWPGCGGDHRGIIGGEGKLRKGDRQASFSRVRSEAAAELGVDGDSAGDEDGASAEVPGRGKRLLEEVSDDCMLEACDEVECLPIQRSGRGEVGHVDLCGPEAVREGTAMLDRSLHGMSLHIAKHCGLDAAEGEVEAFAG